MKIFIQIILKKSVLKYTDNLEKVCICRTDKIKKVCIDEKIAHKKEGKVIL